MSKPKPEIPKNLLFVVSLPPTAALMFLTKENLYTLSLEGQPEREKKRKLRDNLVGYH